MYLTVIAADARQEQRAHAEPAGRIAAVARSSAAARSRPAGMTASMASWTTASSSATPRNAPMTARRDRRLFRGRRGARCGRTASAGAIAGFAARDRLQRRSVGAAAGRRQHPVPQADRGGARQGLQEPADHHRRAERSDAGARQQVRRAPDVPPRRIHRHDRSDASRTRPNSRRPAAAIAGRRPRRAIANFNRAYWRMLLRMYGWGRAA